MKEKKSPSPPSLPPDAQREILGRLSTETRISSQEIAAILKRHGVRGDMDALQDAYRKRLGQRLMSTIRDATGKREVPVSYTHLWQARSEIASQTQKCRSPRKRICRNC